MKAHTSTGTATNATTSNSTGTGKRYRIATQSRVLFIHVIRSGRRLYGGDRADVALMTEREATSWSSRKRAERVLEQAIGQYPKSGLTIVED